MVGTAVLADRFKAGDTFAELAADYDVAQEEIEEAIRVELLAPPMAKFSRTSHSAPSHREWSQERTPTESAMRCGAQRRLSAASPNQQARERTGTAWRARGQPRT